jgi:hypothetical protein
VTNEEIAQVTHEANRVIQLIQGDPAPSPHWDDAPPWQRDSAVDGVRNALDGVTSEESHENWVKFKAELGWVYGEAKNEMAKTHPCLVSYAGLPPEQKIKDHLFLAIVKALS